MWISGDTDLEVRRSGGPLPWLEVLDDRLAAVEVTIAATTRTVWCADPAHVALAHAAFEWWWQSAVAVCSAPRAPWGTPS